MQNKNNKLRKNKRALFLKYVFVLTTVCIALVCVFVRIGQPAYTNRNVNTDDFSKDIHMLEIKRDTLIHLLKCIYPNNCSVEVKDNMVFAVIKNDENLENIYNNNDRLLKIFGEKGKFYIEHIKDRDIIMNFKTIGEGGAYCEVPSDIVFALVRQKQRLELANIN